MDAGLGETILEDVLQTSDPNSVSQGTLISGFLGTTSTFLSGVGVSLTGFATDLQNVDSSYITNTGTFLETVATKLTAADSQTAFVQGYTSTYSASTLATTASNMTVAMTLAVPATTRENIFNGLLLSGSTNSYAPSSYIPGIVTAFVSAQTYGATATVNDVAKATLTSAFITLAGDGDASIIAAAAGTVLSDPVDDGGAFTTSVLGNAAIKTGSGSNGIVGVTAAIANDFTLGDITATGVDNFNAKVAVVQAGIKVDSAANISGTQGAFNVAQAVVQQVLTDGSASGVETTFAANFVGAIDTKSTVFPAINDADRAAAALGIAELYDAAYPGAAVLISSSAVATDLASPLTINAVAQPLLTYFAGVTATSGTATEAGAIAAALVQLPGTYLTTSYTPVYLTSQLILGSKVGTTPNPTVIDAIAQGTLASQGAGADTFLTSVSGDIASVTDLPYLKDVMVYLASGSDSLAYTDTEIMNDLVSVGGAPAESGTLAAILATYHLTDSPAIAYAAAAGSGVATDTLRLTIAQDVAKMTGSSTYAVALSDTLAPLVTTSILDKATLAEDLAKIDLNPTDITAINLDVAQSVPSNDLTLAVDLTTITKDSLLALTSSNKLVSNVAPLIEAVVTGYTGATSGATTADMGYTNAATFTGALVTAEAAVTGIGAALVQDLVPQEITVSGTAAPVAGAFAKTMPTFYASIAQYATTQDGVLTAGSFSDAASIASAILANVNPALAPADSPLTAKTIVANITSGDLTAALATSVVDAADAISKVTALEIETTATDVVGEVPGAIQQATANSVAHDSSSQLVTTAGSSTAVLLSYQEALAEDIAAVSNTLAADQIVANVAIYATSDANIGTIAIDALSKFNTVNTITTTGSGLALFAKNLMSDLAGAPPTVDTSFGYTDVASITKTLVSGISVTAIGGAAAATAAGDTIIGSVVPQQITVSGTAAPVAAAFALAMPTYYAAIAQYATTQDGVLTSGSFSDAASIATAVLTNVSAALAPTDAPIAAKTIVSSITSGDLTAALATSVADAADAISKVTALEIETTATDIVGEVPGAIQQATANGIAHDLSNQLVTTAGASATVLLTDQETLSEDIATVSNTLAADQIAANVAVYAASDASAGTIAIDTLAKFDTVNHITMTGSGVAAFAENLMTDLASVPPSVDSGFGYSNVASIAKTLISGILSTAIGGATAVPAVDNTIAEGLVEEQVNKYSDSPATAGLIGASFATTLPADAVAIASGAVYSSLYTTPLTAEQSGSIGATVAAALTQTALTTPAISGSIAAAVAVAITIPNGQTINDEIATVAGVFASTNGIGSASYLPIASDLAAKANLGAINVNQSDYGDNAIAAIAAALAPGLATNTSVINGLPALLKALVVAYPESAADILGAVIDATAEINGAPSATALETDAYNDLSVSVPALDILDALTMTTSFSGSSWSTADKSSVTTLFHTAEADAANNDYANITVDETPIVPM
jgi:hypothetical protein